MNRGAKEEETNKKKANLQSKRIYAYGAGTVNVSRTHVFCSSSNAVVGLKERGGSTSDHNQENLRIFFVSRVGNANEKRKTKAPSRVGG